MSRRAGVLLAVLVAFGGAGTLAADPPSQPPPQCPAWNKPPRVRVKPSAANPQYVFYNGRTRALVGSSASYLCHLEQPGTFGNPPLTPASDYCEFTNYTAYLDFLTRSSPGEPGVRLASSGLNLLRLWAGLNHSPGLQRRGSPYEHETPFQKPYDTQGAPDEWFFARLRCVLDAAWARDVLVEVTVFDPWEGDYESSPWKVYFGPNRNCFASKDFVLPGGFTCEKDPEVGPRNRAGWAKQKELITELVTRLCGYPNLYYEIANEVDLTGGGLAPEQIRTWHQEMAAHLIAAEAKGNCGHFVAASFHSPANLDGLPSSFAMVNAHYAHASTAERVGAIELLRTRHNGGAGGTADLDRIFGFNETKITSLPSLTREGFTFQSREAARAEAWEFMLSEGGAYNLYGERWKSPDSETPMLVEQLRIMSGLLEEADLDRVQRSSSLDHAAPAWISAGLPAYGANGTRWGAMHSPMTQAGDANFLYIHHSDLEGAGSFQRYKPLIRSAEEPYPAESIRVILPVGTYRAEWIDPSRGEILGSGVFEVAAANAPVLVPGAKPYGFDIALRITRTG